jgi:hypothetical protein
VHYGPITAIFGSMRVCCGAIMHFGGGRKRGG